MEQNSLIVKHRNTFEGGLDTDSVSAYLKSNTYRDAQNVSLVTNGEFLSLTNIRGTVELPEFPGASTSTIIIGIIPSKYTVGTLKDLDGFTVFGFDNTYFKIWAFIASTFAYYELYQEPVKAAMLTSKDALIDGVSFGEYGYDTLYYTDNINEPRKIRCIIPFVYNPNFLTETEIGLSQRKAIGQISGLPNTGGSLLTGTYQAAYQLIDPVKNKYTRFSLLTNPIHIYTSDPQPKAGIGLPSSSKITFTIVTTDDETANYTHFRIAFVKNVFAEGTDAATLNQVGLTKAEIITAFTTGTNTITYDIKSNAQYETTTVDEIVTDLLDLDHVKTLTIKRDRLLLGNITLKDLDYNNGTPSISGGSILKYSNADTTKKDTFTIASDSSTKRGYYRNEVYRFAISYFDKYGNFSSPQTLDLSTVQDNQISTGIDMKFPDRSFTSGGRYYTVLNSADQTVSLGLQLTGVTNHPTWAAGFVVLRAKRKKNILFQTPLVPMAKVFGLGALQNYPNTTFEPPIGSPVTKSYPNATPMGPGSVLMPYNMAFGSLVDTTTQPYAAQGSSGATTTYIGETPHLRFVDRFTHGLIFPPDDLYSKTQFIFTGNETFLSIDTILTQCYYSPFGGLPAGAIFNVYADDNCSMTFFAVKNSEFYNAFGTVNGSQRPGTLTISGNKYFDNLSGGSTLNGFSLLDSSKLTTPTVPFGYSFNNQRGTIIEVNYPNQTGGIAVLNQPSSFVTYPAGTPSFSPSNAADNYSITKVQFGQSSAGLITTDPYGNSRTYIGTHEIINIQSGLQDNRYGAVDEQNEFILTGTQVNFTTAEQATIAGGGSVVPKTVDVWGGDCFVSYHTFKISETVWSITNYGKVQNPAFNGTGTDIPEAGGTTITRYGKVYLANSTDNSPLHIPFFFKNHSQYLVLPLESEYIGSVRDIDTPDLITTQNNIPIYGAGSEYKARAPMGYNYNINLKKENDQKIFFPVDPNLPVQLQFKARVYFSDQKIYNSLINGFDIIRTDNFADYEERYGRLVKLAQGGDNLYGIQDKAIFYLPLNERVLEVTDASQLAVRSGDLLGTQLYLAVNRGSQHIQSIREQGRFVFGVDQINKQVFKLDGQELQFISDNGMISKWQDNLSPVSVYIAENKLCSFYDFLKDEYWIFNKDGSFCYIWNDDFKIWTSNFEFPANTLFGGSGVEGQLYLVGKTDATPFLSQMYLGNCTQLFGTYVNPRVTFVINPELEYAKTFDNFLLNTTDRLHTLDLRVDRELTNGPQQMTTVDLTNVANAEPYYRGGEGGYMLKLLRANSNGARMRGLYSTATLNWNTQYIDSNPVKPPAIQVGLISAVTNARLSSKIF